MQNSTSKNSILYSSKDKIEDLRKRYLGVIVSVIPDVIDISHLSLKVVRVYQSSENEILINTVIEGTTVYINNIPLNNCILK